LEGVVRGSSFVVRKPDHIHEQVVMIVPVIAKPMAWSLAVILSEAELHEVKFCAVEGPLPLHHAYEMSCKQRIANSKPKA
jgi:hypothetical protein